MFDLVLYLGERDPAWEAPSGSVVAGQAPRAHCRTARSVPPSSLLLGETAAVRTVTTDNWLPANTVLLSGCLLLATNYLPMEQK